MNDNKKVKFIIVIGIAVGLLFIIFLFSRLFSKATLNVYTIPKNSTITINNKNYRTGKISLKPGDYTIKASKAGFSEVEKRITIDAGADEQRIGLFPEPESEEALQWANDNPSIMLEREGLAGEQARLEGEAFRAKNPILSQLPYRSLLFSIDYGVSETDKNEAIVSIGASSSTDRSYALSQIKDWGYNPADYTITFTNFVNPLGIN